VKLPTGIYLQKTVFGQILHVWTGDFQECFAVFNIRQSFV
jgi:hypothetical protein